MVDKIINFTDQINKKDLEIILEVNKKAVEIETEMVAQNEEIMGALNDCKNKLEDINERLHKIIKQGEDTSRDIFVMKVLYVTGMLALVGQIIQLFVKH